MRKTFDCVEFMRKRREEIEAEDASLTWEERHDKTHAIVMADPLWREFEDRIVCPQAEQKIAR